MECKIYSHAIFLKIVGYVLVSKAFNGTTHKYSLVFLQKNDKGFSLKCHDESISYGKQ